MVKEFVRATALIALVATTLTGCRACVRENVVWQHTFRTPAQKACPRVRPEYELPPGGPYMQKPTAKGVARYLAPAKSGGDITVTKK